LKLSKPEDATLAAQIRFILRLREGLYKGSALCGGPYGINALGAVNYGLDSDLSTEISQQGSVRSADQAKTREEYYNRGKELFQTIYQHHSKFYITKSITM
jgi:hypothetical protein